MKKLFSIEWPDENGPEWLNKEILKLCLLGDIHERFCWETQIVEGSIIVEEMTDYRESGPTYRSSLEKLKSEMDTLLKTGNFSDSEKLEALKLNLEITKRLEEA